MQWVKSQKPKRCIRWWCSQWDHKNPKDASSGDVVSELTVEKKPRRWQRAKNLPTRRYLLHFFLGVTNDGKPPWLVVIFCFFFSGVVEDGEPPQLVVISLFFFSDVADDDELEGLSSFLSFFLKCRRWQWTKQSHRHLLQSKQKKQEWKRSKSKKRLMYTYLPQMH